MNVVIGNADNHARNLSIIHYQNGNIELAPAYDLTPTTFYRNVPTRDGPKDMSNELGMFINNKRLINDVRRSDLEKEGQSWGLTPTVAGEETEWTISTIKTYLETSHSNSIPPKILEFFVNRLRILDDEKRPNGDDVASFRIEMLAAKNSPAENISLN